MICRRILGWSRRAALAAVLAALLAAMVPFSGARAAGPSAANDVIGDLAVFRQDYTGMSAVPGNMCVARDAMSASPANLTLGYKGASHCVQLDATAGAAGQLYVGGLSPALLTTITLDMGMGRSDDRAVANVYAGGAWLAIRLRDASPTDDLEITSYYYTYRNPTLHSTTSTTPNVGFNNSGRFTITVVSDCPAKTNTIYLNGVEKLTTPYTRYKPYSLTTAYDPFVNPFVHFEFGSIPSGHTANLQLYSIEQTVPEYAFVTPVSDPLVISFGVDGPHAWHTVNDGLSLLDHATVWADVGSLAGYSSSDLAALKALIADGFELGIHFSTRLTDLSLANAIKLMNAETAEVTAMFGEPPRSWCSLQGADNITHAEHAYTNLGMVSRNGVNGSAGGLSSIANLADNCWTFWSSASAAGIVIPSFSHQLDITPAINWSISATHFQAFVSNYASNGVRIVGFREYWEKAQNSYHTDITDVVSDPGASLSFTVHNIGGRSRLLLDAPWAAAVRDNSGRSVPFQAFGTGIVVEVEDGRYTVTGPLSVSTNPASAVSGSSATLNGYLAGMGRASSVQVSFEWGLTTSYGNTTAAVAKTAPGSFSAGLTGLPAGTTYHFRAKAVGDATSYGGDLTFITQILAGPWDINGDGTVDYKDLASLGAHYGETTSAPYPAWDINQDGHVNYKDLALLGTHYGETY